jgi:DNA-binding CsgD family transcriptional regulator
VLAGIGDPEGERAIDEIPEPGMDGTQLEQAIRAYGNVADASLHLGHYQRAERLNLRALELSTRHVPSLQAFFELTTLQIEWLTGRWAQLEQRVQAALEPIQDWPSVLCCGEALLGLLLLAKGRTQQALGLLEPVADRLAGDIRVLTWVVAGIARIKLAEGDPEAAVAACAAALRGLEANGTLIWAGDLAPVSVEAMLAAGRRGEARELTGRLVAALSGRDAPAAAAALATCRGLLAESAGDLERAGQAYLGAEHLWRELPRPYEAARVRTRAGRCILPADADRGHRLLLDALTGFADLGAAWDVEGVRQVLRQHGLVPPHRRGRRSYGNELSPREAEVVSLAAEGLHNREIARTLYLSVKTVEGHLSSATKKLGVSSRSELPDQLPGKPPATPRAG